MFAISYKLPEFSFASFAVIIYLIQKIFSYVQVAQNRLQTISELVPYLASTINYHNKVLANRENDPGKESFKFDRSLEFRNLSFSYNQGQKILTNANFKINKGELIGVIGPSGAGKTTVVDLTLRLFRPDQGEILLDGVPAEKISLLKWREHISYVSQDIFLLNDTIANNIKFYDSKITDEGVVKAAKIANLSDFIKASPQGFDTIVGERGMMLSGGQRQRIILARALARRPKILILDEATSALDNESEKLIQNSIEKLKGKITTLVIAHRLTTIMNSDRLLVLEDGKIIEEGQPKELLKDESSYFYKVYNIRKN